MKQLIEKSLLYSFSLYPKTQFLLSKYFFQATEKALRVSKNPENSLFKKVTLSKKCKKFNHFSLSFC